MLPYLRVPRVLRGANRLRRDHEDAIAGTHSTAARSCAIDGFV